MSIRFTQLQCKEVICVSDGRRLGFVTDVQVELPGGNVCAIVVPCPGRFPGGFGRRDDFIIPWNCIRRIGPDILLGSYFFGGAATPYDCGVQCLMRGFLI